MCTLIFLCYMQAAAAGVKSEDAVVALPAPPRDSPAAQLFSSLLLARLQEEVAPVQGGAEQGRSLCARVCGVFAW